MVILMSSTDELMAEEARQSFFQLENITAYLDSKANGIIALNAFFFTIFTYFFSPISHWYCSVGPILLIASLIFGLKSVWIRDSERYISDSAIKNYGTLEVSKAAAQIAADYADLELDALDLYREKLIYLKIGLKLTIAAMIVEVVALVILVLGSLSFSQ